MHAVFTDRAHPQSFEDKTNTASVSSDVRRDLACLAATLHGTVSGQYQRNVIDPLFIAAVKRANRMIEVEDPPKERFFNAIQATRNRDLYPCVVETKRIWRPRRRTDDIPYRDARAKLLAHHAFSVARELELFIQTAPVAKEMTIIQVLDTAANSICCFLERYLHRQHFFITEYITKVGQTPTTMLAMAKSDLSVFDRAGALRLFADMRFHADLAVKSEFSFEYLPLAPTLAGMMAGNDRTRIACRIIVDTLREWVRGQGMARLPPLTARNVSADQQDALTTRCVDAVRLITAIAVNAPNAPLHVAMACLYVAIAVGENDRFSIDPAVVDTNKTYVDLTVQAQARKWLSVQDERTGRPAFVLTGLTARKLLCTQIEARCKDLRGDDTLSKLLGFVSMANGDGLLSMSIFIKMPFRFRKAVPALGTKTSNAYTAPRLAHQVTHAVKVPGRTGLFKDVTADGSRRLFLLLACMEQQFHASCCTDEELKRDFLDGKSEDPLLVLPDLCSSDEFKLPLQEFVDAMIIREPPLAIVRREPLQMPFSWHTGSYFCAWTVDHDTDGGLCNEHYDLTDRAAFFQWTWRSKIAQDDTWIAAGVQLFNQRNGLRGDYDSDDELVKDPAADSKSIELKRPDPVVVPEASPIAAPASPVAEEEGETKETTPATAAPVALSRAESAADDDDDESKAADSSAATERKSPQLSPSGDSLADVLLDEDGDRETEQFLADQMAAQSTAAAATRSSSRDRSRSRSADRRRNRRSRSRSPRGKKRKASRSPSNDRSHTRHRVH